jgi:protein-S-isoprenylcysteine O-methyltransferase Ste14
MTNDLFFRVIFCTIWLAFLIYISWIRYSLREPTGKFSIDKHMNEAIRRERRARTIALAMFGPSWFGGIILYAVYPDWMTVFSIPLPDWFRLIMVGVSILSIPFLAWSYHTLGKNWVHGMDPSKFLLKKEHVLVTNGPYRYVRHPLYAASFTFILALAFMTANWLVLLPAVAVTALFYARVGGEEAMLVSTFGDEYCEYMKRTPRFIPKVGFRKNASNHPKVNRDEQHPSS